MFAEEVLLRVTALLQPPVIELMLQSVGFLRREHAHEFKLKTEMIVTFACIGGSFESKCAVKRSEIGQAMGLKQRVGFDVAVFDFVQWARATRGMTEHGEISIEKGIKCSGDKRDGSDPGGLDHDVTR